MSNSAILTITGSDSTGGSGVQADIITISALGSKAVSVITSVTLQNTLPFIHIFDNSQHLTFAEEIVKSCFESCISWT